MLRRLFPALACLVLLPAGALRAQTAKPNPPRTWVDKDTGHRVWRMSDEPNSGGFYFNVNAYTPDHKTMIYTAPDGIHTLDLATMKARLLVANPPRPAEAAGGRMGFYRYGVNSGNIPIGSIVRVQAQTQPDGSLLALSVTLESGQAGQSDGMQNDGGKGIITAVTAPGGVLSGFTFVPREGFGTVQANATLTALVASSTIYALPVDAAAVGVPADAFTAAELFPGQSVSVAGTFAASSSTSSPTVDAMRITLAGEGTQGILTSMPQGSASNLSFTLTLPTTSFLTTYAGVTALHVLTSPATSLGDNLTASALAAEPAGTNLEVHGYLIMTAPGSLVLYADEVNAVQTSSSDH